MGLLGYWTGTFFSFLAKFFAIFEDFSMWILPKELLRNIELPKNKIYNLADSKVPENHILCISFHPYYLLTLVHPITICVWPCQLISKNCLNLTKYWKKYIFFCIHSGSALCGLVEWKIIDYTDCHVWPVLTLLIIFPVLCWITNFNL